MSPVVTPETARELGGPDWLLDRRIAAAARFATSELPSTAAEEWRYSRIAEIDFDAYRPVDQSAEAAALPEGLLVERDALVARAATVLIRNGRVVAVDVDPELAAKGLRVGRLLETGTDVARLGSIVSADDHFVTLNDASADPVSVEIPGGLVIDRPIVIAHWIDRDAALVPSRVLVVAGENSQATVVELLGSDEVDAMTVPVTEIDVAQAARLRHLSIQRLATSVHQIGRTSARVGQSGTLELGHVALGGDYARMRFDCLLEGRGATGDITALYLGGGDQMHDLRTYQRHAAADTTSDLVFKGAVAGSSHAVYTGMIHITPEGRGSNANQSNRIINLSPDAWAESVPNLEIEHNDVKCSHASTVGPIDEEQRFYLESRGVPPEATERLVVNGFFGEVIDGLGVADLAPSIRLAVATKIRDGR